MRVVVQFQQTCAADLDRWVESLPGTDPERRELARLGLRGIEQLLADTGGDVVGRVPVPGWQPPVYWLEFHPGWWLRYSVDVERRLLRPATRRIVVLLVTDQPPV